MCCGAKSCQRPGTDMTFNNLPTANGAALLVGWRIWICSGNGTRAVTRLVFVLCALCSLAHGQTSAADDPAIRPFKVHIPQAALDDLRHRIDATRWPDKETVGDRAQGARL